MYLSALLIRFILSVFRYGNDCVCELDGALFGRFKSGFGDGFRR